jgi:hypothetical protein
MAETIDLSGDGGVLKTVVRKAKDDAIAPSDSLPLVDGTNVHSFVLSKHCIRNIVSITPVCLDKVCNLRYDTCSSFFNWF